MLETKTPVSAWKPGRGDDVGAAVVDDQDAAVEDDVGASMVKGRGQQDCASQQTETRETPGTTGDATVAFRLPQPKSAHGDDENNHTDDAWWGEDLIVSMDSDEDDFVVGGGGQRLFLEERKIRQGTTGGVGATTSSHPRTHPRDHPFSAARNRGGGLAGNSCTRCFVCTGEHARNDMVLLNKCNHPLCLECATGWAEKRGRTCPTCKENFDGWHFGRFDNTSNRWEKRFHWLEDEAVSDDDEEGDDERESARKEGRKKRDEKRSANPSRSKKALAFTDVSEPRTDTQKESPKAGSSRKKRKLESTEEDESEQDELLRQMRTEAAESFQTPGVKKTRNET